MSPTPPRTRKFLSDSNGKLHAGSSRKKSATGSGQNNFILWSRFGLDQGARANTGLTTAEAGFEEWSFSAKAGTVINPPDTGGGTAPTPGTAPLAVLALGLLGWHHRSRKLASARA